MELNQNDSKEIVNETKNISQNEPIKGLNYLYPGSHPIENKIRWFKGSIDRGFKSNMAA
tara:strand:- start:784 stop:960 length:177 start_codon:yes stop_codon:yes gene_type:complete